MIPPPRHALVFWVHGIECVLRPGAVLLFGGIAAALDVTFLPRALPGQPALTYHLAAAAMTLLMIVTTLLHEGGHALAYRLQGIWPVRVTLRGSGGGCAAMVDKDTPGRALVRALAGPAVTALVVLLLVLAWRVLPWPVVWRLVAATLAVFSLFDLIVNTLPTHPRCDGTHALRALLWLVRRREPDRFSVLYLWRPLVLAAAALGFPSLVAATGYLRLLPNASPLAGACALALCAVPPGAVGWRYVQSHNSHFPRLRHAIR